MVPVLNGPELTVVRVGKLLANTSPGTSTVMSTRVARPPFADFTEWRIVASWTAGRCSSPTAPVVTYTTTVAPPGVTMSTGGSSSHHDSMALAVDGGAVHRSTAAKSAQKSAFVARMLL